MRVHPQRSVITRALGIQPEVEADLYHRKLEAGDVLILCSDGLWELVEDAEIEQMALSHPPEEAARLMVDLANQRGGPDNISLIILRMPRPAPTPAKAPPTSQVTTPVHRRPTTPRRRSRPAVLGLAVVVLAILGAVGVMMTRGKGQTTAPAVPPTAGAVAQPTPDDINVVPPAGIVPGAVESPTSIASPSAPTATLKPTFTPAAGTPTLRSGQAPPPLRSGGGDVSARYAHTTDVIQPGDACAAEHRTHTPTPTGNVLTPPSQGGGGTSLPALPPPPPIGDPGLPPPTTTVTGPPPSSQ